VAGVDPQISAALTVKAGVRSTRLGERRQQERGGNSLARCFGEYWQVPAQETAPCQCPKDVPSSQGHPSAQKM